MIDLLNLFPGGIALISPQHLRSLFARHSHFTGTGASEILSLSKADNDDDEDDDADPDEDPNAPWYTKRNAWGDKLARPSKVGSTAVIPIDGVITSGLPTIYRAFGYADTNQIGAWISKAAADPSITKILLQIDSPGGMVTGTPELAAIVNAATQIKSVEAHTAGMMDSAAYWIASQADNIFCTESADVGCIGVYQLNVEYSQLLKEAGINAEIIKSGDLKATGHPYAPLSKDQRANIQKDVDLIGVQFRAAVKSKRIMVEDDSMRGQSFIGTEAAARNLVAACKPLSALL